MNPGDGPPKSSDASSPEALPAANPLPLTFHPALAADIPLLRELADRIWRGSYPGMISLAQIDYMLGWMYSAEKLAEEIAAGIHWEIVRLDGAAVGYLAVNIHRVTLAELNKLYLLPALQGRGHGQAMIARACALATARGCPELRLRVNQHNYRALRSYQRAGFRIVESLSTEIGGGFVMDDFVLSRALAQTEPYP